MKRSKGIDRIFQSSSLAVVISFALCFLVDAGITFALFLTGLRSFCVLPLISLVVDAVFALLALITNFRFRYGLAGFLPFILGYGALCIGLFVSQLLVSMTLSAQIVWSVVHIICIVCTCVTYGVTAGNRKGATVIGMFVVMALTLGAVVGYGIFYATNGYLGQGFEGVIRPIRYVYDDKTDSYQATGLYDAKGDTVVISDSYNGKTVSSVNCSVFSAKSVKRVIFEGKVSYVLTNFDALGGFNEKLTVSAPKATIDEIKKLFYVAGNSSGAASGFGFNFANKIAPSDMASDEVYITFSYDVNSYAIFGGVLIDTWIGKKGDAFDATEYKTKYEFFDRNDVTNDEDLDWNWVHSDGYIFEGFKDAEGKDLALDGQAIDANLNVTLQAERIYRVSCKDSNDAIYNATSNNFQNSVVSGKGDLGFKYTVNSIANDILENYPARKGFNLKWKSDLGDLEGTDLSAKLTNRSSADVWVQPWWEMIAPTLELSTESTQGNNVVTYGEKISFIADATKENDDFELSYSWSGPYSSSDKSFDVDSIAYDKSGTYTCSVEQRCSTSSLKVIVEDSIKVTVERRHVNVTWSGEITPDNKNIVYKGADQTATCVYTDGVINDDRLTMTVTVKWAEGSAATQVTDNVVLRNAGNYEVTLQLSGADSEKYEIIGCDNYSFSVAKAKTTAVWSAECQEESHTYNGKKHSYTAIAAGVGSDGSFPLNVTPIESVDAGPYVLLARLTGIDDNNYTLDNNTKAFEIRKFTPTITWGDTLSFTYNGSEQLPEATCTGVDGAKLDITVSANRRSVNAANDYVATISLNNVSDRNNYDLEITRKKTQEFVIKPAEVTVDWGTLKLVYNGNNQKPTASIKGVGNDGTIPLTVTVDGASKNVGSGYSATAEIANATLKNNYSLLKNTASFEITELEIDVEWGKLTFVYDGSNQKPTATITGVGNDNKIIDLDVTVEGGASKDVNDNYVANAEISDATLKNNYKLNGARKTFAITPLNVTVNWSNTSFVYNGAEQKPTATINGAGSDGQMNLTVTVTGGPAINADTYTATTTAPNNNYTLSGTQKEFTIAKRAITVGWTADRTFTYTGENFLSKVKIIKVTNAVEGEEADLIAHGFTYALLNSTSDEDGIVAGTYTVGATLVDYNGNLFSKNYSFANENLTTLTVNKATASIIWGTLRFDYNGSEQKPVPTCTGVNGGPVSVMVYYDNSDHVDAGVYTVRVELADSELNKYTFGGTSVSESKSFTIFALSINITWSGSHTYTYGDTDDLPKASCDSLIGYDTFITTYTTESGGSIDGNPTQVGRYVARAKLSNPYHVKNYTYTEGETYGFEIVKRPVTLTVSISQTQFEGERPSIESISGLLRCTDVNSMLVEGHKIILVEYKYVSDQSGNDNYLKITVASLTILDGNNMSVTENYDINYINVEIELTDLKDEPDADTGEAVVAQKEEEYGL